MLSNLMGKSGLLDALWLLHFPDLYSVSNWKDSGKQRMGADAMTLSCQCKTCWLTPETIWSSSIMFLRHGANASDGFQHRQNWSQIILSECITPLASWICTKQDLTERNIWIGSILSFWWKGEGGLDMIVWLFQNAPGSFLPFFPNICWHFSNHSKPPPPPHHHHQWLTFI